MNRSIILFLILLPFIGLGQDTIRSAKGDTIFIRYTPVKVVKSVYIRSSSVGAKTKLEQELHFYFNGIIVKHWNHYSNYKAEYNEFWQKYSKTNKEDRFGDGFGFGFLYSRNNLLLSIGYNKLVVRELFEGTNIDTLGAVTYVKNKNTFRYSSLTISLGKEWQKARWRFDLIGGVNIDFKEIFSYITINPLNANELDNGNLYFRFYSLNRSIAYFGSCSALASYKINISRIFFGIEGRTNLSNIIVDNGPFKNQRLMLLLKFGVMFSVL